MSFAKPIKTYDLDKHTSLEVTNKGFVLWDRKAGVWIIDASTLLEDGEFAVCDGSKPRIEEHVYEWFYFNRLHKKATRKRYKPKRNQPNKIRVG